MNRRSFLRLAGGLALTAASGASPFARAARADEPFAGGGAARAAGRYGPLQLADANGLLLPAGFRARVVARGGEAVGGTGFEWHHAADGGAVFPLAQGYVYVSNAELDADGGASALRFDAAGRLVDAYPILRGTRRNCAGGATPWGSWLSCEEVPGGLVYECDPSGAREALVRPALGSFQHEAVTVDPSARRLYLSEDEDDGLLYRFTPAAWGDLGRGLLEAAVMEPGRVRWARVPEPNPGPDATPTRHQVRGGAIFDGGEGIVFHAGHVYLATKGDGRIWDLHAESGALRILYDPERDPERHIRDVDNLGLSPTGDLVVAEDPGKLELVLLEPDGSASPLVRVQGQLGTELAGPAFDPSGRRLYFSSQRGGLLMRGITYEIEGPFAGAA
jgi:secreted PhoX family phosphatase